MRILSGIRQFLVGAGVLLLAAGAFAPQVWAAPSDYTTRFQGQIQKVLAGLERASQARKMRLKGMNDSLQKTARAAEMFSNWQVADPVLSLLESAQRDYPHNFFAVFLKALIFDLRGDHRSANRFFEEFLLQGATYTDFEISFISQADFQAVRRETESLLAGRGISLRGHENEMRFRVPMQGLENYRRRPAFNDQALNIAFLVVMLGGGLWLLLKGLGGAEFWLPPLRSILGMYLAVWIAYAIWLLDLVFGLPYGVSRFKVISVFLGVAAGFFLLRETLAFISEKMRPLERGFKRCPHCRAVIVELATECFYCKERL